jgi:hypothetical protein
MNASSDDTAGALLIGHPIPELQSSLCRRADPGAARVSTRVSTSFVDRKYLNLHAFLASGSHLKSLKQFRPFFSTIRRLKIALGSGFSRSNPLNPNGTLQCPVQRP